MGPATVWRELDDSYRGLMGEIISGLWNIDMRLGNATSGICTQA